MCAAGQDLRHRLCPSGALHIKAFVGLGWAHGTALKSPEPKHPTWDETLQQQAQPCSLASGAVHMHGRSILPFLSPTQTSWMSKGISEAFWKRVMHTSTSPLVQLLPENKPSLTHHTYFYGTQAVVC